MTRPARFFQDDRAGDQPAGGRLVLAGVRDGVRDVLRRCRLDKVLSLVPDVGEAVERARQ